MMACLCCRAFQYSNVYVAVSDDIDEIDDLDHANGEKEEVHLTSIYEPKYKDICEYYEKIVVLILSKIT